MGFLPETAWTWGYVRRPQQEYGRTMAERRRPQAAFDVSPENDGSAKLE
jgi:hypothetical protein